MIGFSFPVVPKGKARIRTQMSAAHTDDEIDRAVAAFAKVGRELGVIAETERDEHDEGTGQARARARASR